MYLYKTTIYKITDNVVGIDVGQNDTDKTDFDNNRKSSAIKIDNIVLAELTFEVEKTYTNFSALITGGILWSDVKYTQSDKKYELYLLI